jgi:hypothetical protein
MVHVPQVVAVHAIVSLGFRTTIVESAMLATTIIQLAHVLPSPPKNKITTRRKEKKEQKGNKSTKVHISN